MNCKVFLCKRGKTVVALLVQGARTIMTWLLLVNLWSKCSPRWILKNLKRRQKLPNCRCLLWKGDKFFREILERVSSFSSHEDKHASLHSFRKPWLKVRGQSIFLNMLHILGTPTGYTRKVNLDIPKGRYSKNFNSHAAEIWKLSHR